MLRLSGIGLPAALLFIGASALIAHAQAPPQPQIYGEPDGITGADCEGAMARLDFIAIAAEKSGEDETVIIIARLGSGESSRGLIAGRLRQVADYLSRRLPRDRVVTAEGARVRGLGQLEFYVAGKLHSVFRLRRNRDLVKGCAPAG